MRYLLELSFNGANYHGFQNQTNLPTVQGHIDKALEIISAEASAFNYSGRTDAGVHALKRIFILILLTKIYLNCFS